MRHIKQSDAGIVPVKVANKGLNSLAESLGGRAATKMKYLIRSGSSAG